MRLYIYVETDCKQMALEYMEVAIPNMGVVTLDWDEAIYDRTERGFLVRLKGISINGANANGKGVFLKEGKFLIVRVKTPSININNTKIARITIDDENTVKQVESDNFKNTHFMCV